MFIAPIDPPRLSELTLDPSLLTRSTANYNDSGGNENKEAKGLDKIEEELSSNKVSSSCTHQDHSDMSKNRRIA